MNNINFYVLAQRVAAQPSEKKEVVQGCMEKRKVVGSWILQGSAGGQDCVAIS